MKNSANSIKASGNLLIALIVMIAFSSCSGYTTIEKRHYRDGFYISKGKGSAKAETKEPSATNGFSETGSPSEVKSVPANPLDQRFVPDATVTMNKIPVQQRSVHKEPAIRNVKVEQKEVFKPLMIDTLTKKGDKPEHQVSKKEKLGKTGYTIFMIAVVALVLVFIAAIAAFILAITGTSAVSGGII